MRPHKQKQQRSLLGYGFLSRPTHTWANVEPGLEFAYNACMHPLFNLHITEIPVVLLVQNTLEQCIESLTWIHCFLLIWQILKEVHQSKKLVASSEEERACCNILLGCGVFLMVPAA